MSGSYSFLSKNFVLSECKGTKKMRNEEIVHFAFSEYLRSEPCFNLLKNNKLKLLKKDCIFYLDWITG